MNNVSNVFINIFPKTTIILKIIIVTLINSLISTSILTRMDRYPCHNAWENIAEAKFVKLTFGYSSIFLDCRKIFSRIVFEMKYISMCIISYEIEIHFY